MGVQGLEVALEGGGQSGGGGGYECIVMENVDLAFVWWWS